MLQRAAIALLLVVGCTPFRPNEPRVERVWPPDDGEGTISPSISSGRRASGTDEEGTKASRIRQPVHRELSDEESEENPTPPVMDSRLTSDQQERLSAQLEAMSQPLTATTPEEQSPPVYTDPASSTLQLTSYFTVEDEAPAGKSSSAPGTPAATAQPPVTTQPPVTAEPAASSAAVSTTSPASNPAANERSISPATQLSTTDPNTALTPAPTALAPIVPATSETAATSPPAPASATGSTAPAEVASVKNAELETPSASSPAEATEEQTPWREHLKRAVEGMELELAKDSLDAEERNRIESTLRLLYVAQNRREDALKPIETLPSEQQEFWKLSLAGFLELLDPEGPPVNGRRAKLALRHLRDAIHQLAAASSLDVRNLALCQRVDSFGSYKEFEPYEFRPEQEVILYVEVANFAVEPKEGGYETELQGSYQILDGTGRRVADYDLMLDKQICRNVRTDYFLPYVISMPKNLAAGSYRIQVTIEDKKGRKFGQTPPVEFKIAG